MSDRALSKPPASSKKPAGEKNLVSRGAERPRWRPGDLDGSLDELYEYVIEESLRSEAWYWKHKGRKAFGSHLVQWTAVALAGLAAIGPIAIRLRLFPGLGGWLDEHGILGAGAFDSGLFPSLCLGISGALVAFDRASGLSSGWARYMLTGSAIRSACEEFRMDWAALRARLGTPAKDDVVATMLQRAKAFRMVVEALVMKETQDWATEFQNNLAQMEKDLKSQVDQARAVREKAEQEAKDGAARAEQAKQDEAKNAEADRLAAQQPGSLEASVLNLEDIDDFKFDASLENAAGASIFEEKVEGSKTWARIGVPPGEYKLTIRAQVKKRSVASALVVAVKPGQKAEPQVTLPTPAAPP